MNNDPLYVRVTEVQARYADELMGKPHVIGVAVGFATVNGEQTNELALVVMVERKVAPDALPPEQRIPATLDGVRVDVQEVGTFTADAQ